MRAYITSNNKPAFSLFNSLSKMSTVESDSPEKGPQAEEMVETIGGCPRAIKDLTEALLPTLVEQFSGSRRLIGRSGDDGGHGSNRSGVHDDYDADSHSDGVGPQRARGNGGSEISSGNGSGDEAGGQSPIQVSE